MIVVTTWLWGQAYGEHYVQRLAAAVKRNLKQPNRFICFTDNPRPLPGIEQWPIPDPELTSVKGCFARVRLFDPELHQRLGIEAGGRIANLDLDVVVTGPLDPLFGRNDDFTILQGVNTTNPCPMNGSIWMLKAGAQPEVWAEFSLDNYRKSGVPFHAFPDDQGWFNYMMPDAGSWGPRDGVYGFEKFGWPSGDALPEGARVVAFPGWRDPAKFGHLDWVRTHWRDNK